MPEYDYPEQEPKKRIRKVWKSKHKPLGDMCGAPVFETQEACLNLIRSVHTKYKVDPEEGKLYAMYKGQDSLVEITGYRVLIRNRRYVRFNLKKEGKGKTGNCIMLGQNLMWLCRYGYIPPQAYVDFIDGDTTNIRIGNLKLGGIVPDVELKDQVEFIKATNPENIKYSKAVDVKAARELRLLINVEPDIKASEAARRVKRSAISVAKAMKVIKAGDNLKCERMAAVLKGGGEEGRKQKFAVKGSRWVYFMTPADVFLEIE